MKYLVALCAALLVSLPVFALQITSGAFDPSDYFPSRYTCDANNYSPPLVFRDVPASAKSLVLICDDADAPLKWTHWLLINIPPDAKGLDENINVSKLAEMGVSQGKNDYGKTVYSGPCPPSGWPHRYVFSLYALDTKLMLKERFTKSDVIKAMRGHIIAQTNMVCLYHRLNDQTPNY